MKSDAYVPSFLLLLLLCLDCDAWSPSLNLYQSRKASGSPFSSLRSATTTQAVEESSVVLANDNNDENNNSNLSASWYRQKNKLRRYTEQALRGKRRAAVWDALKLVQGWTEDSPLPTLSYNAVLKGLKAWADENPKQNWETAVKASEEVLADMERRQVADVVSYTTYLATLGVRRGTVSTARRATRLLATLPVTPNVRTYNAVLYAWIQSGTVRQARNLFDQWQADADIAPRLRASTFALMMSGYIKCRQGTLNERYTNVIDLWERLWDKYEESLSSSADECTTPTTNRYRPTLHALTSLVSACQMKQTPEAAQIAQDALERYYQLGISDNVEREEHSSAAENSVQDIDDDTDEDDEDELRGVHASIVTSVLDCWQKSGDHQAGPKAQALLEWMVDEYRKTHNPDLQPNAYTFSAVIGAWARSRMFGKSAQSQKMLEWMKQLHDEGVIVDSPNVYCYTGVINCCAYSQPGAGESKQALDIAINTYQQMQQGADKPAPTNVSYASFLTVLEKHVPRGQKRTEVARRVFADAANRGQVCHLVLRRLHALVSEEEAKEILMLTAAKDTDGAQLSTVDSIPAYWRRNVGKIRS